ncbi:MAG: hypothetical protein D6761_08375 [Candidatus Dadabacteria bacterium]|nr:MAG: hypothetical protein D6761_08375 [Candidatus Dadabacteria bacterium]
MRGVLAICALLLIAGAPAVEAAPLPDRLFSGAAVAGPIVITRYDVYVEAVISAASDGYRFEVPPNRALMLDALRARLTRTAILDAVRARGDIVSSREDRERLRRYLLRAYGGRIEEFVRQTGISERRFEAEVRERTLAQAWIRTLAATSGGGNEELARLDRVRQAIERVRSRYFERYPVEIVDPELADALPFPSFASE